MKEEGREGPAPAPESSKHGERQTRGAEGVEFEMSTARRIETPNALKGRLWSLEVRRKLPQQGPG